jgi:hypothetical protein
MPFSWDWQGEAPRGCHCTTRPRWYRLLVVFKVPTSYHAAGYLRFASKIDSKQISNLRRCIQSWTPTPRSIFWWLRYGASAVPRWGISIFKIYSLVFIWIGGADKWTVEAFIRLAKDTEDLHYRALRCSLAVLNRTTDSDKAKLEN